MYKKISNIYKNIKNKFNRKNNLYMKSVTYFGNDWPITFWNSKLYSINDDFKQIKEDGFNSIILVIPWKEFQPSISPISYNKFALDRLDEICKKAEKYNLKIYARLGYLWDYYNDSNETVIDRFLKLLYKDSLVINAWNDYLKTLYNTLKKHKNFKDSFLTWEDFWIYLPLCEKLDPQEHLEDSRKIGYTEWIKNNISLELFNKKYNCSYNVDSIIPIPNRNEPEMETFFEFYDNFLNHILENAQKIIPNISMEIRIDQDLIYQKDGNYSLYSHKKTYSCLNSDFISAMYGIHMGFENKGEKVTSNQALEKTEFILKNTYKLSNRKPIYIEQFLFSDNTPYFNLNAKIKEEEIGNYLIGVANILKKYTCGYGIWPYKDYKTNLIFNSNFVLKDLGWHCNDEINFEIFNNYFICHMKNNGIIAQKIPFYRNHFDSDTFMFSLNIQKCIKKGSLKVTFGNQSKQIFFNSEKNYEIKFNKNLPYDISIELLDGECCIDNLKLYSFIQKSNFYNVDDAIYENSKIEYIRELNKQL